MAHDDRLLRQAAEQRYILDERRKVDERAARIRAEQAADLERRIAWVDDEQTRKVAAELLTAEAARRGLTPKELETRAVTDAVGKAIEVVELQNKRERELEAIAAALKIEEAQRLELERQDAERLQQEAEAAALMALESERRHEAIRNEPIPGSVQKFIAAIARAHIDREFENPAWLAQAETAERVRGQLGRYDALTRPPAADEDPADLRPPFSQFAMPENSASAFVAAIAATHTIEPSRSDLSLIETGEQVRPFGLMEDFVTAETKQKIAAEVQERETIQQQFGRAADGLTQGRGME